MELWIGKISLKTLPQVREGTKWALKNDKAGMNERMKAKNNIKSWGRTRPTEN